MKGDTGQNLIGFLERRLDAVVYRAKFAPTIFSARQIVSHGHIYVNGVKCNIASRLVKPGDEISLGKKAQEMALVMEAQSLAERDIPDYVAPDGNAKVTYVRVPTLDEVPYPEIGRASCRERVCQYVEMKGVDGSLKKKNI